MRITTSAFLALAACASADVKVSSKAGQRLMSKARELENSNNNNNDDNSNGDAASSYMNSMKYYQNSWNGNGNGYGNNQNQNANQNYQGDQQDEDQDQNNQDGGNDNGYQEQYASSNQQGGSAGGSNNWMSGYSLKFDGCASDYESDADGGTTTELLARFKLCPNSSGKRCRHAGEYVLPMADFVDATQGSFVTDENCAVQEETCYSKCQEQARYGSANDDDNNGGRRLQYWWQQWGSQAEKSSREEEEDAEEYQKAKYSNQNYQQYNGGNNAVAAHYGEYDASATGQNTYSSQYQQQMEQYTNSASSTSTTGSTGTTGTTGTTGSTTESEQYDENNYYYNRGNWRNNDNTGSGSTGSGSTGSSGASDSSTVNQDNSYWGGYSGSSGSSNQNSYNSNGNGNNGNNGRNADYDNYFDEEYCRYDCMSNAGMAYCSENTEQNGANGYNDLNLRAMVECQPLSYFDSSTNPLYTGATCRDGGVYLDTFTDSACTQTAPKGTFEEAIGYNLPDQNLVNNDLLKCSSAQTITGYFDAQNNYNDEYAENQYESAASPLCDVLYQDSGRCETYMKKDSKDESGCGYINRMGNSRHAGVWLRYGIGLVIAACFLLAAYIGYSRGRREEAALVIEAVQSSVTSMFNKANKSLKQPLAPENDTQAMESAAATGYVGATIPVVTGEDMTTAPIPAPIAVQHDEEPTEVKKENNVV